MVYHHVSAVFTSLLIELISSTAHSWASPRTLSSAAGLTTTSTQLEVGTLYRTQKRSGTYPIYSGIGCEGSSTLYREVGREEDIPRFKIILGAHVLMSAPVSCHDLHRSSERQVHGSCHDVRPTLMNDDVHE